MHEGSSFSISLNPPMPFASSWATCFSELIAISHRGVVQDHLGVKSPPNLVFVPGVMGKSSSRVRPRAASGGSTCGPVSTWTISGWPRTAPVIATRITRSAPSLSIPAMNHSRSRFWPGDFGHRHFAYDWRKLYSQNTRALRDLILKMHETNGGYPVHVVAHSMGGLMVRATLREFGDDLWPVLGRIAFVGTPHYGSTSIAGYLKNHLWGWDLMAVMGLYLSRQTFRSLMGVLSCCRRRRASSGTRPAGQPQVETLARQ